MKIKNIYFGYGLEEDDNYYMFCKGFRGDILVQDSDGSFYAMGFENVENVSIPPYDFRYTYIDFNGAYYIIDKNREPHFIRDAFRYWIIVEKVNIKTIFATIKKLEAANYFQTLKPIPVPSVEERKKWTLIPFEGYENNAFYLELCSEIDEEGKINEV